jgi:hypothetical protein
LIIQHRQRPLEIHLPQLVGLAAFEALAGRRMAVLLANQAAPQQNAMNRAARQFDAAAAQQFLQLACTPVWIALPRRNHLALQPRQGLLWTEMRTAAAFGDAPAKAWRRSGSGIGKRNSLNFRATQSRFPLTTPRALRPRNLGQARECHRPRRVESFAGSVAVAKFPERKTPYAEIGCHRGVSAGWSGRAIGAGTVNFWDLCACEELVDALERRCLEHRVQSIRELIGGLIEPS